MPRIRRGVEPTPRSPRSSDLARELVEELGSDREFGQPIVDEQHFPRTDAIRVTVIWDKWEPLADEERAAIILEAYEEAESREFRDRIALAIGVTFPEAYESGLLPFEVVPMIRQGDPVDPEACRKAMIEEGASLLFDPGKPRLRFATQAQAEACMRRLGERLPGSEPVWGVVQEIARSVP